MTLPDLYHLHGMLTDDDLREVATIWDGYSRKLDGLGIRN
jgi:hypothetical protein